MLSERELAWLNDYHAEVLAKIGPQLDGEDAPGSKRLRAAWEHDEAARRRSAGLRSAGAGAYILGPRAALNRGLDLAIRWRPGCRPCLSSCRLARLRLAPAQILAQRGGELLVALLVGLGHGISALIRITQRQRQAG